MQRRMLITGCSSGFGLEIARIARTRGWAVLGTVRREQDAEGLKEAGCDYALLDLCDEDSTEAFGEVARRWAHDGLHCLVNNAGTTYPGPSIALTREDLRAQFEVNTIGQMRVTRQLMPPLVAARGRVLFISSVSAFLPTPMLGAYAASKRALEALAEAFCLETSPLGLSTCVIEPGSYKTQIWETSVQRGEAYLGDRPEIEQPFYDYFAELGAITRKAALGQPMGRPAKLAAFVVDKAEASKVPMYAPSPGMPRFMRFMAWLMPVRWLQRQVMKQLRSGRWRGAE